MTEVQEEGKLVEEELSAEIHALDPEVTGDYRRQVIGLPDESQVYTQKPLSFFGKMRLAETLGKALRKATSEGGGPALASLLGSTEEELKAALESGSTEDLKLDELKQTARFMEAIGVLLEYAPDLLVDLYLVALGVPTGEREWAKETMQLPVDDGGLSDADGFAILETFIDQNAEALQSFFVDQVVPLISKFVRGDASAKQPPLNRSQRRTQKGSKSSSSGPGKGSS